MYIKIEEDNIYFGSIIQMTRSDWRTCKQAEAEVIQAYIFQQWIEEYQAKEQAEFQAREEEDLQLRRKYEWLRNAGDRAASRLLR